MASNTNIVVIGGNLTRDPELRALPSGTSVCTLRIANNRRMKDSASGEWRDRPGYFDVTVWGAQGENCAKYLKKGRSVTVTGELRWREWETDGVKRQAVDINANEIQWHWSEDAGERPARAAEAVDTGASGSGGYGGFQTEPVTATTTAPPAAVPGGGVADPDDDIPFLFDTVPAWETIKGTRHNPFA